jgi:hypothetical protein
MEITQHARYTCTFCGKVRLPSTCAGSRVLNSFLHTGQREALGRRHLELRRVPEGHRRRRVDRVHHRGCDRAQVRSFLSSLPSEWPLTTVWRSTIRRLREITEA